MDTNEFIENQSKHLFDEAPSERENVAHYNIFIFIFAMDFGWYNKFSYKFRVRDLSQFAISIERKWINLSLPK